jgi:hypothetical protein
VVVDEMRLAAGQCMNAVISTETPISSQTVNCPLAENGSRQIGLALKRQASAGDSRPGDYAPNSRTLLCKEPDRRAYHLLMNGVANVRKNGRANISTAARTMAWVVI